jgi:hypothetical protein
MTPRGAGAPVILATIVLAASSVVAFAALVISVKRVQIARGTTPDAGLSWIAISGDPVAAEADVFRTKASVLAIDPGSDTRRGAHPRTLTTYRRLRAYPGAPPRIPHGLTPGEVLKGGCTTCHERGGYSHRFEAYVPVTPHPEMGICLQCHVGDVKLMAIPLPDADPSARCRQCHSAGGVLWKDSSSTWKPLGWPRLARSADDHAPPAIPHSLEFRTNCVACHAAPSAVREIRTLHSDRANCRQCHVESNAASGDFMRPRDRRAVATGGSQ